ncbi:MAG: cytochrome P450 [Actinomycetota bacterium]|nr:cytochrome P450 [Actinomycetota bacterium]
MDLDPMQLPPAIRAGLYSQMELPKTVPLACPQQHYIDQISAGGLLCPMDGVAFTFSRELTDFVLRSHELFSSASDMPLGNVRPLIPLNIDPPQHSKYRKILDPLFAPKAMDRIEDDVRARANKFIDEFIDRGEVNFSEEFAEKFPSAVFLGLMGLPWDQLETLMGLRDGILHPERFDPQVTVDPMARFTVMNETGQRIYAYFNEQLDAREAIPTDDILNHFITAQVDGERMSRNEILDLCYLFLIAGLDTVSDSLTCMFAYLATHPEHRAQIVDDPAIIPSAVEELLRWESPVPYGVPRVATRDVVLPNGATITEGTAVTVSYGGANIDPSEYADWDTVRFDRDANRHIAFGGGVHRCLGSHLARRELRIALGEWHSRIPVYGLKAGHEQLEFPPGLRHVKDLTLAWDS